MHCKRGFISPLGSTHILLQRDDAQRGLGSSYKLFFAFNPPLPLGAFCTISTSLFFCSMDASGGGF